jgi:hypothetical protein
VARKWMGDIGENLASGQVPCSVSRILGVPQAATRTQSQVNSIEHFYTRARELGAQSALSAFKSHSRQFPLSSGFRYRDESLPSTIAASTCGKLRKRVRAARIPEPEPSSSTWTA